MKEKYENILKGMEKSTRLDDQLNLLENKKSLI